MKLCEHCLERPVSKPRVANSRFCSRACKLAGCHGVDHKEVARLYVEGGQGLVKTAARYGCCVNTVLRALARHGLRPRPRKGAVA